MYNKAVFMGRICNDLELKTTPSGVSVLSFTIAVERQYQADKQNKVSDFFPCIAWRNEADFISRFWSKGKMILVEGELQNRKYTDKANVERQVTELIVDRACFTGEKASDTHEQPPPPEEPPQHKRSAADNNVGGNEQEGKQLTAEDMNKADDEDYPF